MCRRIYKKYKEIKDIPCPILECPANDKGICTHPEAIIFEENFECQIGLEYLGKKNES